MTEMLELGKLVVATDQTMAYEVNRDGSRAQSAVDARIGPIAAGIIASDPTLQASAEALVDGALTDSDVLRQKEVGAVRTLESDDPDYSEVHLSRDFRRIGGLTREGDVFEAQTADGFAHSMSPAGRGTVLITRDYRRVQPGGGANGVTPQAVLDEWGTRMSSGTGLTQVTCFGDSMIRDNSDLGTSVAKELGLALSVLSTDRGYSGDTPTQVAARMGALNCLVTIADGVLPASGTVPVTVSPSMGWRGARDWQGVVTASNGRLVQVRLAQDATPETGVPSWTLQQVSGSGPVSVLPGTRFKHVDAQDRATIFAPTMFWAGRNDLDVDRGRAAVRAVLEQKRDPSGRVLVLSVMNRTVEPSGSAGYVSVKSFNDMLAVEAGANYFDGRAAIIRDGLAVAGITATDVDTTAIAEDRVPPSLLADTTHLNVAGRVAFARILANEILGRNW